MGNSLNTMLADGGFDPQSVSTPDNLTALVNPEDQVSEKIITVMAKYQALEDCLGGLKKGFEKEAISLEDYLKHVRNIS